MASCCLMSIKLVFLVEIVIITFLYSPRVKAAVSILCVSFKSKLISALIVRFSSPFLSLPSHFLKCSCHIILTLFSLLFAFIIHFLVRPDIFSLLIYKHFKCYWFDNSTYSLTFCSTLLSMFVYILCKLSFDSTNSS